MPASSALSHILPQLPRSVQKEELNVEFVKTNKPLLGGRNVFIRGVGLYILARGPGSLRSFACTQANTGFISILDWRVEPSGRQSKYVAEANKRTIIQMAPPILGQWPLDASFEHGLVVEVSAQDYSPMLTVVWFLAEDMGVRG